MLVQAALGWGFACVALSLGCAQLPWIPQGRGARENGCQIEPVARSLQGDRRVGGFETWQDGGRVRGLGSVSRAGSPALLQLVSRQLTRAAGGSELRAWQ